MWIFLEIVLWGYSNLYCQQSRSVAKHHESTVAVQSIWQSPVRNQQPQFNPEETVSVRQSTRVHRSGKKLLECHKKFFGKLLSMKSRQAKISNSIQGEPMPEPPPTTFVFIFVFFLNIMHLSCMLQKNILSCACFSKKSFHESASAKHHMT